MMRTAVQDLGICLATNRVCHMTKKYITVIVFCHRNVVTFLRTFSQTGLVSFPIWYIFALSIFKVNNQLRFVSNSFNPSQYDPITILHGKNYVQNE